MSNFYQPVIQLLKNHVHDVDKVLLVNEVVLKLFKNFIVYLPHDFEQKWLLDLNSVRENVTQFIDHKLEFSFLHIDLVIIAEKCENLLQSSVQVSATVDYQH